MFSPESEPYVRMTDTRGCRTGMPISAVPVITPAGLVLVTPPLRSLEEARAATARSTPMKLETEFPDYPAHRLPPIPEGWTDMSWANDACPCFGVGRLIVFIDYPEPSERECPESKRFSVQANPETDGHNETFFDSDDWNAVLAFVSAKTKTAATV